jgi:predicted histidine transporter YuiF (NhaC family)
MYLCIYKLNVMRKLCSLLSCIKSSSIEGLGIQSQINAVTNYVNGNGNISI